MCQRQEFMIRFYNERIQELDRDDNYDDKCKELERTKWEAVFEECLCCIPQFGYYRGEIVDLTNNWI